MHCMQQLFHAALDPCMAPFSAVEYVNQHEQAAPHNCTVASSHLWYMLDIRDYPSQPTSSMLVCASASNPCTSRCIELDSLLYWFLLSWVGQGNMQSQQEALCMHVATALWLLCLNFAHCAPTTWQDNGMCHERSHAMMNMHMLSKCL